MLLFVVETENDNFFIAVGLLISTNNDLIKSFNRFKKKVDNLNIKLDTKSKLCNNILAIFHLCNIIYKRV